MQVIRAFWARDRGGVAVVFAVVVPVVMAALGVAVDYAQAEKVRTELQAALASDALAASRSRLGQTAAPLTQQTQSYVSAVFSTKQLLDFAVSVTVTGNVLHAEAGGS